QLLRKLRGKKTVEPCVKRRGAPPDNHYTPATPYTIIIESNHVSDDEAGYGGELSGYVYSQGTSEISSQKLRWRISCF
ncbi:MAG: DUF6935 domain-containing protein, partial [Faecousia sp.]